MDCFSHSHFQVRQRNHGYHQNTVCLLFFMYDVLLIFLCADVLRIYVHPCPSLSHALHVAPNQPLLGLPSLSVIVHDCVVFCVSDTKNCVTKWSLMDYWIVKNYAAKTGHLQDENLIFHVVNDFLLFLLRAVSVDVQCGLDVLVTHDGLHNLHIALVLAQSRTEGMS